MSSGIRGGSVTLENLIECLEHSRLASSVAVASAALIFYDWLLTYDDELSFFWRRGKITCGRILFVLARYPGLACAIVGLLPLTTTINNVTTCLTVVTILSSELILAMRTWAIWERSRAILVFLVVLTIACAIPAIAVVERDAVTADVVSSATSSGTQTCRTLMSAIKLAWVVPYVVVIVFEVVVLSLTLYKVLRLHKDLPLLAGRSKLLDVLWIDGVIYFIFMLSLGIVNVGLALHVSDPELRDGFTQLQTVSHSILSTRIVLHTGRVLRRGPVVTRFADVPQATISLRWEVADSDVELQAVIN
ncbi:hypothetical protein BC827DRAFT_895970 [Russula dissimulans]|nr:hypothetical protein BC827DRAFT_895970 [Russula dissimulans]